MNKPAFKAAFPLPPECWDFRAIADLALPDATVWEYAITSKICPQIVSFLESEIEPKTTVRRFLVFDPFKQHETTPQEAWLWLQIEHEGLKAAVNLRVWQLVEDYPIFPKHWVTFAPAYTKNKRYSALLFSSASSSVDWIKKIMPATAQISDFVATFKETHPRDFVMKIDWRNHSIEEMVNHFDHWIRAEAKKHPEMKKAGKRSQAPKERLRWLAAYRLSKAGMTYEQAYAALSAYVVKLGLPVEKRSILPIFENASSWSEAIRRAGEELATFDHIDDETKQYLALREYSEVVLGKRP